MSGLNYNTMDTQLAGCPSHPNDKPITTAWIKNLPKVDTQDRYKALLEENARFFIANGRFEMTHNENDGSGCPYFNKFEAITLGNQVEGTGVRVCENLTNLHYYLPEGKASAAKSPKIKPLIPEKAITLIQDQLNVANEALFNSSAKLAKLRIQIDGLTVRKTKLEELIRISRD